MSFSLSQLSSNVFCILEEDVRGLRPLSYIIIGDELVLLIDTGCGCGNMYTFVRKIDTLKTRKILVVNTHNHPEQTGGNFRFSTTGKFGLALQVEGLCASKNDKYYTKLMESSWHWEVGTYKVTRWLSDGDVIELGNKHFAKNVVQVLLTPGHTPDSLVLWYAYENRMFWGDLFYRFDDIMFTYDYTNIKQYETSLRRILQFIVQQPNSREIRYSAAKNDSDNLCLPDLKHYHRFILAVLAGTHSGTPLRIDEAEGWRFETRDHATRIVLSRSIVHKLQEAREKAQGLTMDAE